MNKITQHVPNCVDIDRDKIRKESFQTQEELLSIPWVDSSLNRDGFYRYSISKTYIPACSWRNTEAYIQYKLMVEKDDGYWWWVIGYLDNIDGLDLPEWKAKYKDV